VERRDYLILIDHVNVLDRTSEFVQSQDDVTKSRKRNQRKCYRQAKLTSNWTLDTISIWWSSEL